jgi:hypothetical protein
MEPADIYAKVEAQGFWSVTDISNFVGAERGTVRRMFLRGRLGAEMILRGVKSPRGQRRFADSPDFRWQLEQLREHHARPDSRWQESSPSRRNRIAKLATICRGEFGTDEEDRLAGADVLRALAVLWKRQVGALDSPALLGALDMAGLVRSRRRFADERLFSQICQAALMLEKPKENGQPEN